MNGAAVKRIPPAESPGAGVRASPITPSTGSPASTPPAPRASRKPVAASQDAARGRAAGARRARGVPPRPTSGAGPGPRPPPPAPSGRARRRGAGSVPSAASTTWKDSVRRRLSTQGAPGSRRVKVNTAAAPRAASVRTSGHTIWRQIRRRPAPSIRAASSQTGSTRASACPTARATSGTPPLRATQTHATQPPQEGSIFAAARTAPSRLAGPRRAVDDPQPQGADQRGDHKNGA